MKRILPIFLFLISFFTTKIWGEGMSMIDLSRNSTVEITSAQGKSKGTGFFISHEYIATCFHVISTQAVQDLVTQFNIFQDIKIKTRLGEILNGVCVSIPSQTDPSPLQFDFAVLKVTSQLQKGVSIVKFAKADDPWEIGSEVIFSGYPLATPAMVTHKGMISGIDPSGSIICIQAPINKGNSGGALLSSSGEVLGIISMREGGISRGLNELTQYIQVTSKHGSVTLMGVDPLQSIHAVIQTIDTYISTGIGYAINIKHLHEYLQKHPEYLK